MRSRLDYPAGLPHAADLRYLFLPSTRRLKLVLLILTASAQVPANHRTVACRLRDDLLVPRYYTLRVTPVPVLPPHGRWILTFPHHGGPPFSQYRGRACNCVVRTYSAVPDNILTTPADTTLQLTLPFGFLPVPRHNGYLTCLHHGLHYLPHMNTISFRFIPLLTDHYHLPPSLY